MTWLLVPVLVFAGAACGSSGSSSGSGAASKWCSLAKDVHDSKGTLDALDMTKPDDVKKAFTQPSTIFGMACSCLPSSLFICSASLRSFAMISAGTSSR